MLSNAPPPYKPSPEVQAEIEQQLSKVDSSEKRRRTVTLPKRNWIQRNPRLFQITFLTTSLLVFFSKPLYDAFIADPLPPTTKRIPAHKR